MIDFKGKRMLLPSKISKTKQANFARDDDRFIPVELRVMHDGINRNGSLFDRDSIVRAEWSLKDIPIRGYIIEFNNGSYDFDEHNMEIVENEDGWLDLQSSCETIGLIPQDTNIHYENYGDSDRTYLVTDGFLWSRYLNEGHTIFGENNEKSVSMEIEIEDGYYDEENDVVRITDYRYLSVVVLGEHVEPGMEGANIRIKTEELSTYAKGGEDLEEKDLKLNEDSEIKTEEEFTTNEVEETEIVEKQAEIQGEDSEQVEESQEEIEQEAEESEKNEQEVPDPIQQKIKEMEEKLKNMTAENQELKAYKEKAEEEKRERQLEELFNTYGNSGIDIEDIKNNTDGKSVTEIENEIAIRFLRDKFSKSAPDDNKAITWDAGKEDDNVYGRFGVAMAQRNKQDEGEK